MRPALILVLVLAVLACAPRPGPDVLLPVADGTVPDATTKRVWMVTTRARDPVSAWSFGSGRAPSPDYGYFDISVPPDHKPGAIEWPKGRPDPATDFVTLGQVSLAPRAFLQDLGHEQTGVYVHGFNTSFQEALYRLAQLSADAHVPGNPVLFSWPSQAHVAGYIADRDGADYSRSALAGLLSDLSRGRKTAEPVMVLGHSMGGRLTMEALRQLKLEGRSDVLDRLEVILAAPDIDLDMFREQMAVIGQLKHPLTVLVSSDDKALAFSARLAARRERLGTVDVKDPAIRELARRMGIRIIDITDLPSDDPAHSRYVSLLSGAGENAVTNVFQGLRQAGAYALDQLGL
ncbi:alpha/beta fold hydrolase [Pseudomonas sp. GX19020]|uniref:alpha/beta hydrolase n=1 Tax=Pseudomonas sp. GX19020 TaxID=2942277 RepID=UPI0020196203|nr:alpha/beta fold hydrolase [Pseudomonas sp. GX19020]MCL4067085.1 alpha/beta fold hydrolase [Pseudomonas sp. GX19020]